jgi:hypothetical protein
MYIIIHTYMTTPSSTPVPLLRTRLGADQLLHEFRRLLPAGLLARWLRGSRVRFYQRAFSPLITLWYLVFQRLGQNHCLSGVVEDALAGGADVLSRPGKRLSAQLRSLATTSFSDARQRLPLEVCQRALWHTADRTVRCLEAPKQWGLRTGLLDGSTVRLRRLGDISRHFAPHRPGNCKKQPYWCLARVLAVVCWASGAVLDSAMAALTTSEQALCAQLAAQRRWKGWLLVGDRNFGVYGVVRALVGAQAQVLVRLTQARARKLARSAGLEWKQALDAPLLWTPSRKDRCPQGLTAIPVAGRLVVLRVRPRGFRPISLCLFTTLSNHQCAPAQLAQIYGLRWNIELCLRYIKAQMDLGFLECRSAQMARKEWLAGLIAYNLIRWTMGAAAALAAVPVSVLSFSRARELLVGWCLRSGLRLKRRYWKRLLSLIGAARLPKRRKPRPSEPRAIRHLGGSIVRLEGSRAAARRRLAADRAKS